MAFVVPNVGERTLLGAVSMYMTNCTIFLYNNDITPNATDVLGDYTQASDFTNMSLNWGSISTDGSGRAYMVLNDTTFTQAANTTQTIYGYYIQDGSGNLICAEKFTTSYPLEATGDQIRLSGLSFRLYN